MAGGITASATDSLDKGLQDLRLQSVLNNWKFILTVSVEKSDV